MSHQVLVEVTNKEIANHFRRSGSTRHAQAHIPVGRSEKNIPYTPARIIVKKIGVVVGFLFFLLLFLRSFLPILNARAQTKAGSFCANNRCWRHFQLDFWFLLVFGFRGSVFEVRPQRPGLFYRSQISHMAAERDHPNGPETPSVVRASC